MTLSPHTQISSEITSPLAGVTGPELKGMSAVTAVYQNPVPVGVAIIPVYALDPSDGKKKVGVLAVRRGIEPMKGALALPGGFMGYETWREATGREVQEETGVQLRLEDLMLVAIRSVRDNTRMLFFSELPYAVSEDKISQFVASEESSEIKVLFEPTELAFSTHTEELANFFERRITIRKEGLSLDIPKEGLALESQRFLLGALKHFSAEWPQGRTGFLYAGSDLPRSVVDYVTELGLRLGFSVQEEGTTEYGEIIYTVVPGREVVSARYRGLSL